jgi:hypothetical protein
VEDAKANRLNLPSRRLRLVRADGASSMTCSLTLAHCPSTTRSSRRLQGVIILCHDAFECICVPNVPNRGFEERASLWDVGVHLIQVILIEDHVEDGDDCRALKEAPDDVFPARANPKLVWTVLLPTEKRRTSLII